PFNQRYAEITLKKGSQITPILHPQRIIQAEIFNQLLPFNNPNTFTGNEIHRIAGQSCRNEDQRHNEPNGKYHSYQAIQDKRSHFYSPLLLFSSILNHI